MRRMLRFLAVLGFACGLIGGQQALAFGGYGGGGWHGSGGGWHGGGGHWHGGGWGGWGYPLWGYGWASPYLYAYPYDYGYDYPPPPGPDGGLYCVTKAHLCALTSARAPGARCSCSGVHGRVSVLQGQ